MNKEEMRKFTDEELVARIKSHLYSLHALDQKSLMTEIYEIQRELTLRQISNEMMRDLERTKSGYKRVYQSV